MKHTVKTLRCTILLEHTPNGWMASVPELPDCMESAETQREALDLIRDAITLKLKWIQEGRQPLAEILSYEKSL